MSQFSKFGKIEYYSADLTEDGWNWCYSAAELQRLLADEITGQKIHGIYVGLYGYLVSLEMSRQKPDTIDMSYLGSLAVPNRQQRGMLISAYKWGTKCTLLQKHIDDIINKQGEGQILRHINKEKNLTGIHEQRTENERTNR